MNTSQPDEQLERAGKQRQPASLLVVAANQYAEDQVSKDEQGCEGSKIEDGLWHVYGDEPTCYVWIYPALIWAILVSASLMYSGSTSYPMYFRPDCNAAIAVVPLPMKGSRITSS